MDYVKCSCCENKVQKDFFVCQSCYDEVCLKLKEVEAELSKLKKEKNVI